jgi:drug/metabolite transporter (DMT)-like permease
VAHDGLIGHTAAMHRRMTALEWAMLLTLSALWGGSFFFTAIALRELPPLTIVALRVGLAAMILSIVVRAVALEMPRDRRLWADFFGMGLLNNVAPFCLIVWGQTAIGAGLASILNATTPLWTVVVAHVFTADEKLTSGRLAGVMLGFVGVAAMIGPEALGGLGNDIVAQLACVAAAISYAFAGVYGRRFKRTGVAPMLVAAGQLCASSAMIVPIALLVDRPWTLAMPGLATSGAILGIAALGTALAYVLYFRILAGAGATNLLLVTFLIPVSAIILGSVALGERLDLRHAVGMALIGIGLAAIDARMVAWLRPAITRRDLLRSERGHRSSKDYSHPANRSNDTRRNGPRRSAAAPAPRFGNDQRRRGNGCESGSPWAD